MESKLNRTKHPGTVFAAVLMASMMALCGLFAAGLDMGIGEVRADSTHGEIGLVHIDNSGSSQINIYSASQSVGPVELEVGTVIEQFSVMVTVWESFLEPHTPAEFNARFYVTATIHPPTGSDVTLTTTTTSAAIINNAIADGKEISVVPVFVDANDYVLSQTGDYTITVRLYAYY